MTNLTAKDVMTADVIVAKTGWSVQQLAEVLLAKSISGAPVVDDAGKLVGVVSITDVTRTTMTGGETSGSEGTHEYFQQALERKIGSEAMSGMSVLEPQVTVGDIMTNIVFGVAEDEPVQRVASTMLNGRIHRVCVTRDGKLVGVLSAFDMLRVVRDL